MSGPQHHGDEEDFLHLRHRRVRMYGFLGLTFVGLLLASRVSPRTGQIDPELIGAFVLSCLLSVLATGAARRSWPWFTAVIVAVWAAAAWSLRG